MIPSIFRFAGLCLFVMGLSPNGLLAEASDPKIVASIAPVHALVSPLMQDIAEPELLIPADVSPHHFAMRPSDARKLKRATLLFRIGPAIEPNLDPLIEAFALESKTVNLWTKDDLQAASLATDLTSANDQSLANDGHVWLDPRRAGDMVRKMAKALSTHFPAQLQQIGENQRALIERIEKLDRDIDQGLSDVRQVPVLTWHNSFSHFADRYGLQVIGSVTDNHDVPPSAARLRKLLEEIGQYERVCLLVEPGSNQRALDLLDRENIVQREIDILGRPANDGPTSYVQLMSQILQVLRDCR